VWSVWSVVKKITTDHTEYTETALLQKETDCLWTIEGSFFQCGPCGQW